MIKKLKKFLKELSFTFQSDAPFLCVVEEEIGVEDSFADEIYRPW